MGEKETGVEDTGKNTNFRGVTQRAPETQIFG